MTEFKVITIWQPYASLVAWGEKRYETRSWEPYSRTLAAGEIVMIHAAKRKPGGYEERIYQSIVYQEAFLRHGIHKLDDLPYGAIIAAAKFIACHPVEGIRDGLSMQEKALGDYRDGRFAWELEIVKVPDVPIVAVGKQGIWRWSEGS